MAIQPTIAGYSGTLSGTPVLINPQSDRGFVSEWLVVIPTGTGSGVTVTIGNDVIPVPVGLVVTIPGPAAQFTINSPSNGYIIYAGTGPQPLYALSASATTPGGGNAPDSAPYILDSATANPALANGVPIGALAGTLEFVRPTNSPAGAVTPILLRGSDVANPPTTGGGASLPFQWESSEGVQNVATIAAAFTDTADPNAPLGGIVMRLGQAETLAFLFQAGDVATPQGITLAGGGKRAIEAVSGSSLDVIAETDLNLISSNGTTNLLLDPDGGQMRLTDAVDGEVEVFQLRHDNPTATYAAKTRLTYRQTDPFNNNVVPVGGITGEWDTNNPASAGAGRFRISTRNGPFGTGNETSAYIGWFDDVWAFVLDGTNYGASTTGLIATGAGVDVAIQAIDGDIFLRPKATAGTINCTSSEVTTIADGTATDSAAACGQFFSDTATFQVGQSSISFAVDAKFNGKPVQVTLASIPGGALAATPIAFRGVVSAASCTVSIIDTTTGALLVGGAVTAFDVAVFITSAA